MVKELPQVLESSMAQGQCLARPFDTPMASPLPDHIQYHTFTDPTNGQLQLRLLFSVVLPIPSSSLCIRLSLNTLDCKVVKVKGQTRTGVATWLILWTLLAKKKSIKEVKQLLDPTILTLKSLPRLPLSASSTSMSTCASQQTSPAQDVYNDGPRTPPTHCLQP